MSLYNGNSEGFDSIVNGYIDYAEEIIAGRAIPDIRDGLKPVQRRIIYSTYFSKKRQNYLQKCMTAVSDALVYHPHGDSSVYGSFTLLTDENGTCNVPFFHGMGNLGKVYLSKPPAAPRYPKFMVNENADLFFREKDVMDMIPSEEGEGEEPSVLPAVLPFVLVNGTSGIAVAAGTAIPSFNVNDVIDMSVRYLENGKLDVQDIIVPDFPTGGVLVKNDTELAKIMLTGRGRLKIRAKVEIQGKNILVQEVPFGKTVESIINAIKKAEIKEISDVTNIVGRNSPAYIMIGCKTKKAVEYVLMELYRRNILQNSYASNMLVIEDGEPLMLGVHGIISKWCEWRKGIVVKKYKNALNNIKDELTLLDYFLQLVDDRESCEEYSMVFLKQGKRYAMGYLKEFYTKLGEDDIPDSVLEWISKRDLSALHNGDRYRNRYSDLKRSKQECEYNVGHPDLYIINELNSLKPALAKYSVRKTVSTYVDYKFSKIQDTDTMEDTSYCIWTLKKNGFLRKTREFEDKQEDILSQFEGCANDILIGFDNFGRVIRVVGSDIPFTGTNDNGVYMAKYLDCAFQEDYKMLYLGKLDGKTRMLVYRDGYVGFLDTSEWYGKKVVRVVKNGVPLKVYDKLLEVVEEENIPNYLVLADDESTQGVVIGIVHISDVRQASRLSSTKVLSASCPIDVKYLAGYNNLMEVEELLDNAKMYMGKLRKIKDNFIGDPEELQDGTYLGICRDFESIDE